MKEWNLAILTIIFTLSFSVKADDLNQIILGSEVDDILGSSKESSNSPFIVDGEPTDSVEKAKSTGEDFIFNHNVKEVSDKIDPKKQYKDVGYVSPGTFENQENYLELDKNAMARGFRKVSEGALNLTFIKNDFSYTSTNDVINRTISEGYKSVKGGALFVRHDSYLVKSLLINAYWSLGAGLGYNSGRGIFSLTGERSDTTFNLWEAPIDLGVGLEIPVYSWFKIAGTGGASGMFIMQNRSDYESSEKGKRKYQFGPGYFANAQFKINLTGFSGESAYDAFSTSEITNISMNLEARHHSYSNFNDAIEISGTSFGLGFTFEYL